MANVPFETKTPVVHDSVFVAPDAWITGDVTVSESSSIFYGSVLRGDILPVSIGARSNIQEHSVLHTSHGLHPCLVGSDVTIGHRALIHGCQIKDRVIIGMGSIILDGAIIEMDCIIGAGSLVPMNKIIPAGSLAFGSPIKIVRDLTPEEIESILQSSRSYQETSKKYKTYFDGLTNLQKAR
jgi:carbonic anhydrase/acetyltransferase-like protein (isoleucine patch superfamily)